MWDVAPASVFSKRITPSHPNAQNMNGFRWGSGENHFSIYTRSWELKNLLHLLPVILWWRLA
jgi:hypothetical protein